MCNSRQMQLKGIWFLLETMVTMLVGEFVIQMHERYNIYGHGGLSHLTHSHNISLIYFKNRLEIGERWISTINLLCLVF